MPQRVQRRRTRGWRMFRRWLAPTRAGQQLAHHARQRLRGYHLACWCPLDGPCHADILLTLANSDTEEHIP